MRKLWYIFPTFPLPSETFASIEAAALRKQGVELSIHTFQRERPDASELLSERGLQGVQITHGSLQNRAKAIIQCVLSPVLTFQLLHWILRWTAMRPSHLLASVLSIPRVIQLYQLAANEKPDVVHLYWGHYPSLLGLLITKYLPTIVVSTSLSAYDLTMEYGCTIPLLSQVKLIRTWAKANVGHIERLGGQRDRIWVCYQGLELGMATPSSPITRIPGRIVTAGRLIKSKGIDQVIEVFRQVYAKVPTSSLVILGEGPMRSELEKQVQSSRLSGAVNFLGHVPQRTLYEELLRGQVFLFLSEHEAERLPNVVKEAMASGCICISSNTPGIEEIIQHNETGYIVSDSPDQIARLVSNVLENSSAHRKMSEAARQRAHDIFCSDQIAATLVAKWEELIQENQAKWN